MISTDKPHFAERLRVLFTAHGKPIDEDTLRLYWSVLRDIGIDDFNEAILMAAQRLKYPAKPAELAEFSKLAKNIRIQKALPPPGQRRCTDHTKEPSKPSTQETVWWCDRCTYFLVRKLQPKPDDRETMIARVREIRGAR